MNDHQHGSPAQTRQRNAVIAMNATIKIEKGIPIPKSKASWSPISKALDELNVGDSFAVPHTRSLQTGVSTVAKRRGIKVVTRTGQDSGVKMLRVWRVK